jgi:hypothetical protein
VALSGIPLQSTEEPARGRHGSCAVELAGQLAVIGIVKATFNPDAAEKDP